MEDGDLYRRFVRGDNNVHYRTRRFAFVRLHLGVCVSNNALAPDAAIRDEAAGKWRLNTDGPHLARG